MKKIKIWQAENAHVVDFRVTEGKYYIVSTQKDNDPSVLDDVYFASKPADALSAYLEDQIIGDLLEYGTDTAYEAVPEDMLEKDQIHIVEIEGFSWGFHEDRFEILYKGEVAITFYAIEVAVEDEDEDDEDDEDENCGWFVDETCNYAVGFNDGWN